MKRLPVTLLPVIIILIQFVIQCPGFASASSPEFRTIIGAGSPDEGNITTVAELSQKIMSELRVNASNPAEANTILQENSIIVIGTDASTTERLILKTARLQSSWLAEILQVDERDFEIGQSINSGRYLLIILVGGPTQNGASEYAYQNSWLNESYELGGGMTAQTGMMNGTAIVVLSDQAGYQQAATQEGLDYSPLNGLVPREYIPATATGIAVILLALFNLSKTVFEFKALDIGRKDKKVGEGAIILLGVNITELAAIFGASLVLGVSLSWQFFGPSNEFFQWVVINTIICLAGAILHEISHRLVAHIFKIKVEYRFWPAGSALTLISSYLGNAFSVQGFVLEEIDPKIEKWKVGLMKLTGPLVSAGVMVVFALVNFFNPSPVFKVIYSTSALWAMAEMLPFNGLDGKDIKDWNWIVWGTVFAMIGITYALVTFIL